MGQPPCTPADLPHAARLAALLGQGDIDRFLVPIHSDESLARLFHGLPPFSVFAPPCQTCGSARSSRNPRYRGGGPPALERKPFCLGVIDEEGAVTDRSDFGFGYFSILGRGLLGAESRHPV